jgi:hypothetical protein
MNNVSNAEVWTAVYAYQNLIGAAFIAIAIGSVGGRIAQALWRIAQAMGAKTELRFPFNKIAGQ